MLGLLSVFAIVLSFVLGFVIGEGTAKVVFLALILTLVISLMMNLVARDKLTVRIKTDGGAKQKKVRCRIRCFNEAVFPMMMVRAKLVIKNTFNGETKKKNLFFSVPRNKEIELRPEMEVNWSGKYKVEIKDIRLQDLLGITKVKLKIDDKCFFTILPELLDVNIEYNARASNSFDNELYSPYQKGQDRSEVYQIREYEQGDNLRQVHWKLTSKWDRVMVKDSAMPLDKKLMVVMDKSLRDNCSLLDCEHLAEATLSIAENLIEEDVTYKLLWSTPSDDVINEREIQFEHELMEAISGFLEGKPEKSDENFAELYGKLYESVDCTHVIYISIDRKTIEEDAFGTALVKQIVTSEPNYKELCSYITLD